MLSRLVQQVSGLCAAYLRLIEGLIPEPPEPERSERT